MQIAVQVLRLATYERVLTDERGRKTKYDLWLTIFKFCDLERSLRFELSAFIYFVTLSRNFQELQDGGCCCYAYPVGSARLLSRRRGCCCWRAAESGWGHWTTNCARSERPTSCPWSSTSVSKSGSPGRSRGAVPTRPIRSGPAWRPGTMRPIWCSGPHSGAPCSTPSRAARSWRCSTRGL